MVSGLLFLKGLCLPCITLSDVFNRETYCIPFSVNNFPDLFLDKASRNGKTLKGIVLNPLTAGFLFFGLDHLFAFDWVKLF